MQNHQRMDFLLLSQQAYESLMVSFPDGKDPFPRDEKSFLSLSRGERIPIEGERKPLLSPLLIEDKTKGIVYPAFFFSYRLRMEEGREYLSVTKEKPERNRACLEFLDSLSLGKEKLSFSSLESFATSLSALINSSRVADKISFFYSYCFFPYDVLSSNAIYSLLSEGQKSFQDKYKGLFSEVKEETTEKNLVSEKVGYFSKQERSLKRRDEYKASSVSYDEKSVFDDFLFRTLLFARRKKESLLLIAEGDDWKVIKDFCSSHRLQDDILFLEPTAFEEKKALLENEIPEERGSDYSLWEEKRERFEQKRNDCFLLPPFFRSKERGELLFSSLAKEKELYSLDVSFYGEEQAEKDKKIIDEIRERTRLLSDDLLQHPFYGLDSSGGRKEFDTLQLLLLSLRSLLSVRKEILSGKRKDYYKPLTSLQDIEERFEERKFIKRYDGFSLQRFTLSAKENKAYPLEDLKKRFKAVSSLKLLTKEFFDDSIFSADIQNRIRRAKSDSYFERRKGRKRIRKYQKDKGEKDEDTLIKILSSYWKNYSLLQTSRPKYRKIYGDNITTRSYITESESRRNYVHEFEKKEKENPSFSFHTPFILSLYRNEEYRKDIFAEVDHLQEVVSSFKEKRREYRFYFPLEEERLHSYSLKDYDSLFERRQKGTYDEFSDFAFFHQKRISSSFLRQKTRREKYILLHKPISSFKDEFFLSLLSSFYRSGESRFLPYRKDYFSLQKERITKAKEQKEEEDSSLRTLIRTKRRKDRAETSYRDEKRTLLSALKDQRLSPSQGNPLYHLLSERYPIILSSPLFLGSRKDECFDISLILNSKSLSSSSLLNGIRVAKKVLFLSPLSSPDNRIQGLHYTYLSNDGIYRKMIPFSLFPPSLLKLFKDKEKKYGYSFIQDDPRYPYRIKKKGRMDLGLFPSFLLPSKEDREGRRELNRYLIRDRDFSLLYFHREDIAFHEEEFFSRLFLLQDRKK